MPEDTGIDNDVDVGGEMDAGLEGGSPAPERPDFLLDGYDDAEAQARAFHQFHGQFGPLNEIQEQLAWYRKLQEYYHTSPENQQQFDQFLQGWGQAPQQPQQPQLQPQQPPADDPLAFLQHTKDPSVVGAYQLAIKNGGVLPQGFEQYQDKFQAHQKFWDDMFLDPVSGIKSLLGHPDVQQIIAQAAGQQIQPLRQHISQQHGQMLLDKYGRDLSALDPEVKELFQSGALGTGEKAAQKAIALNKRLAAGQQQPTQKGGGANGQPPKQQQQQQQGDDKPKPKQNNQPQNTLQARREAEERERKQAARQMAKAKVAELNGRQ